jgi:hypothetical protein
MRDKIISAMTGGTLSTVVLQISFHDLFVSGAFKVTVAVIVGIIGGIAGLAGKDFYIAFIRPRIKHFKNNPNL